MAHRNKNNHPASAQPPVPSAPVSVVRSKSVDDQIVDPVKRDPAANAPARPAKKDRIKFTCPGCRLNAWAKPAAKLSCQTCSLIMSPHTAGSSHNGARGLSNV